MDEYHYVWLIWASAFLVPWLLLWFTYPRDRTIMLRASVMTMAFGLTEPVFVPEYWNPPSLFDLAQRSGFDLESFVFTFAIGGIGVTLSRRVRAGLRRSRLARGGVDAGAAGWHPDRRAAVRCLVRRLLVRGLRAPHLAPASARGSRRTSAFDRRLAAAFGRVCVTQHSE